MPPKQQQQPSKKSKRQYKPRPYQPNHRKSNREFYGQTRDSYFKQFGDEEPNLFQVIDRFKRDDGPTRDAYGKILDRENNYPSYQNYEKQKALSNLFKPKYEAQTIKFLLQGMGYAADELTPQELYRLASIDGIWDKLKTWAPKILHYGKDALRKIITQVAPAVLDNFIPGVSSLLGAGQQQLALPNDQNYETPTTYEQAVELYNAKNAARRFLELNPVKEENNNMYQQKKSVGTLQVQVPRLLNPGQAFDEVGVPWIAGWLNPNSNYRAIAKFPFMIPQPTAQAFQRITYPVVTNASGNVLAGVTPPATYGISPTTSNALGALWWRTESAAAWNPTTGSISTGSAGMFSTDGGQINANSSQIMSARPLITQIEFQPTVSINSNQGQVYLASFQSPQGSTFMASSGAPTVSTSMFTMMPGNQMSNLMGPLVGRMFPDEGDYLKQLWSPNTYTSEATFPYGYLLAVTGATPSATVGTVTITQIVECQMTPAGSVLSPSGLPEGAPGPTKDYMAFLALSCPEVFSMSVSKAANLAAFLMSQKNRSYSHLVAVTQEWFGQHRRTSEQSTPSHPFFIPATVTESIQSPGMSFIEQVEQEKNNAFGGYQDLNVID